MAGKRISASVGVDDDGNKHVLGFAEGASENSEVAAGLLRDLVERGVDPARRRLFVIDGSKALRKAIDLVFGATNPVQRCRNHKLRNVLDWLPKREQLEAKDLLRAVVYAVAVRSRAGP